MEERRVMWRIEGRVQGVGYRWSAREEARRLGLSGWVRNEVDGAVTLAVAGPPEAVEALRRWCLEGPARARVERILLRGEASGALEDPFEVRH